MYILHDGHKYLRVDVLSDASPASSAVEPAVDQEEEGERTDESSQSGAINTEDAGQDDIEEAGGRETELSVEDGDSVASSDDMEDGDGDGVSA